jgi:tRNA 2-thiouridine synthesizing protein A
LSKKELKYDKTIDVRGLLCPFPIIKAEENIRKLDPGKILEILTTDPKSKTDIPAWATKKGHQLLIMEDEWISIKFLIKKSSGK